MAKLNNVEIHFKHSNRTYNTMTAFLVMFDALQTLFKDKYCYKVVLWSVNFYEAL